MQKTYINSTLFFFFYLIVYNNTLISMQLNITTTNPSSRKEFYYNPILQELVDISDKSINNDLLSVLQAQNFEIYNLQSNLFSQNLEIIASLSSNNDKTNYHNLLNLLSQNLEVYNNLSNMLFKNTVIFEIPTSLNNNEKTFHKDKKQFKCLDCNQCFATADQLNVHKIMTHSNKQLSQFSILKAQNFEIYNLQSNLFSQNLKIIASLNSNNDKSNYHDVLNLLSQNLEMHKFLSNMLFQNAVILTIPTSLNNNEEIFHKEHKKQFKCPNCSESFEEANQLSAHKIIHSDKKLFQCSLCHHKFYTQEKLDNHKLIHEQRKTFQCDICFRNFRDQTILGIHQKSHSPQKSLACSFCNKKFKTQQGLKVHQSSHSKQAHFLCTYPGCDKKYKDRSSLCKHKTVEHIPEEDKKFVCLECSKKFALKSLVIAHIKWTHHINETDDINHTISYTK